MKNRCLGALAFVTAGLAGCVPMRTDVALPGGGPRALAVGDVNGDGKAEIVVGHRPAPGPAGERAGASVLTPLEGETFRSQLVELLDVEPDQLLLVDLNGDGKLDLVVRRVEGAGGSVRVLLGRGDGSFSPAGQLPDVGRPLAVAAGDLDGDGKVDLVVSSAAPAAPLQVHRGLGDGTFAPPERYYGASPGGHLAVGDVNGDHKVEVVMGTADGNVDVLLADDRGRLTAPIRTRVGEGNVAIALGDLAGDGHLVIVAAPDRSPSLSLVAGLGTLFTAKTVPLKRPATSVAAGDVDGCGKAEIVTLDRERSALSLLKQNKEGDYHEALTVPVGERPVALALANLHGDGQLDAVTANERGGSVSVIHFFHQ